MIRNYLAPINLLLLVVAAILAGLLTKQWESFNPEPLRVVKAAPVNRGQTEVPDFSTGLFTPDPDHPFDFYQQVIDLNLFRMDRKEVEDTKSALSKAADAQAMENFDRKYKLLGVAVAGQKKLALLSFLDKDKETKRVKLVTRMVAEGQKVRDFQIQSVEDEWILVVRGDDKLEVHLSKDKSGVVPVEDEAKKEEDKGEELKEEADKNDADKNDQDREDQDLENQDRSDQDRSDEKKDGGRKKTQ
jgi:hypothetical protein